MREYRLGARDMFRLSWRQFLTLLGGLSPNSVTVTTLQQQPEVLEGEAAERAIEALFT